MSAVFHYSFSTVMPIILLILVGVLARHRGYLDVSAFRELNRFNFRYALFARVFVSIYQIESIHDMPVELAVFAVVSLFVLLLFGIVFSKAATKERFRRGVLIQSAFRSNYAVIGMPVAEALVGTPGMQLAAFLQLPVITFFNLVSVIVLSIFSDPEAQQRFYPEDALTEEKSPAGTNRGGAGKMLKGIAANPLIQGVLLGFVALIIRQLLPCRADGEILFSLRRDLSWLYSAILSLSRTATPMALIILGGQRELKEIEDYRRELISGVLVRLAAGPLIGFAMLFLAVRLGLLVITPVETAVFVALFASPQAVSSTVMSTEMGGDGHLAGQIVVWSSILGMFSLFVIVFLLRMRGLL